MASSSEATDGKTRVQVELNPREVARMNYLMEVCEIDSRKDLFNNATSLLEWVVMEIVKGRRIAAFDDETRERHILSMPILANAARHSEPVQRGDMLLAAAGGR